MILILKQKRVARGGALKLLDFALTRCPPACERFVDKLGLKTLFSIFMGKSKVRCAHMFRIPTGMRAHGPPNPRCLLRLAICLQLASPAVGPSVHHRPSAWARQAALSPRRHAHRRPHFAAALGKG